MISFSQAFKSLASCAVLLMTSTMFAQNIVERLKAEGYRIVSTGEEYIGDTQYAYDVTFQKNQENKIVFKCDAIYYKGKNVDTADVKCDSAPRNVDDKDIRAIIRAAKK